MRFFTSLYGGRRRLIPFTTALLVLSMSLLVAQTDTNSATLSPSQMNFGENTGGTNSPATNAPPAVNPTPIPVPATPASTPAPAATPAAATMAAPAGNGLSSTLGALIALASIAGFLLYQSGLTRAKNCGHSATLLLTGVFFGLGGYWVGGFAVQMGGIGDAYAALAQPFPPAERGALDHELRFLVLGHHWGLMGNSGFFLETEDSSRNGIATLFLAQAALAAIAVAAALGAALERGRLLAMAFCAYLIGVLIYPLLANWVWGGGWLAAMGREFGLGHGVVDVAGAGVVHETAGVLALVIAVVLGPRHGRFGRNKPAKIIPGHNMPLVVLGTAVLLISWMAVNALASASLVADPAAMSPESSVGLAAVNTLLAAMGGLMISFALAAWQKRRPEPARLCRGLLGGAIAGSGGAGLIDPWAAFVIGGVAGLLVQGAMAYLERKRIDDPAGAAAVHGAGGAWGLLAVGLFANGTAGNGINGVATPVRGLFFGGAWHQLAAQAIGCASGFIVVSILGYLLVSLVQKILGNRAERADEIGGLDWPEVGALGYQGDVEPEE
jgi:Amt family ammonium transporter